MAFSKRKSQKTVIILPRKSDIYDLYYTETNFCSESEAIYMTAKEELSELISSLTKQELEIAIKVFRAHSSMKQGEPPPPILIDQTQNRTIPA